MKKIQYYRSRREKNWSCDRHDLLINIHPLVIFNIRAHLKKDRTSGLLFGRTNATTLHLYSAILEESYDVECYMNQNVCVGEWFSGSQENPEFIKNSQIANKIIEANGYTIFGCFDKNASSRFETSIYLVDKEKEYEFRKPTACAY